MYGEGMVNTISRRNYQQDYQSAPFPLQHISTATANSEGETAITIFLLDSLSLSSTELHRRLEAFPGARIVGETGDTSRAVAMLKCLEPQLVIVNSEEHTIEG